MKKLKVSEAREILKSLQLPPAQTNERSARVLLALANISPDTKWEHATCKRMTVRNILDFIREHYFNYAENSRETIRRQSLHQFEQAAMVLRNSDDPARPTNSSLNNYCLSDEILNILRLYPDKGWKEKVLEFLKTQPQLQYSYSNIIQSNEITITLPNNKKVSLSPGPHNQLHADIINKFIPNFAKTAEVVYIGDTASSRAEGGKYMYLKDSILKKINASDLFKEKLPDIVLYQKDKNWLYLIEAVVSHGPIDDKRYVELENILSSSTADRIYVTAFPNQSKFRINAANIAWETEVWIADAPEHMIHFNGDKFLGPYQANSTGNIHNE